MTDKNSKKVEMFLNARETAIKTIFTDKTKKKSLLSETDTDVFLESGNWDKIRNSILLVEYEDTIPDETVNSLKQQAISVDIKEDGNDTHVYVVFMEEKYHVPIHILFRKKEDIADRLVEKSFISKTDGEKIVYYTYMPEENLAGNIVEIMKNLEFIPDLESYEEMIAVLEKESLDGRRIKSVLEDRFNEMGLDEKRSRLKTIYGYENYPYMKKRWNTYLKNSGKKTPEWNVVIRTFKNFMEPVIEAIEEDRVFLNDWMPELGRYLD